MLVQRFYLPQSVISSNEKTSIKFENLHNGTQMEDICYKYFLDFQV